jgi:hypothetical protein
MEIVTYITGTTVSFSEDGGGSIRFSGPVIREGVWNGIYVPADAIREAKYSVLGRYWLNNHQPEGTETDWNNTAMGIVTGVDVHGDDAATEITIEPFEENIPPSLMETLRAGGKVGVSADFKGVVVEEDGEWNGTPYRHKVISMYYLHVAHVPKGACSVEDGCYTKVAFRKIGFKGDCSMTKKNTIKEPIHLQDDEDVGGIGELDSDVVVVSFTTPDDVVEYVNEAQALDDPVDALARMMGLADWVVENWEAGTGPFMLPPEEPAVEEGGVGLSRKPNTKNVPFAKKDKATKDEAAPAKAYVLKRLRALMPNLPDDRMEAYVSLDEGALVALVEDLETVLDEITTLAGAAEEIIDEVVDEADTINISQAKAPAKPATKIRLPKRTKPAEITYGDLLAGWNKRLGIKPKSKARAGGGS